MVFHSTAIAESIICLPTKSWLRDDDKAAVVSLPGSRSLLEFIRFNGADRAVQNRAIFFFFLNADLKLHVNEDEKKNDAPKL